MTTFSIVIIKSERLRTKIAKAFERWTNGQSLPATTPANCSSSYTTNATVDNYVPLLIELQTLIDKEGKKKPIKAQYKPEGSVEDVINIMSVQGGLTFDQLQGIRNVLTDPSYDTDWKQVLILQGHAVSFVPLYFAVVGPSVVH